MRIGTDGQRNKVELLGLVESQGASLLRLDWVPPHAPAYPGAHSPVAVPYMSVAGLTSILNWWLDSVRACTRPHYAAALMDATHLVWLCSCQFLQSLYIEDGLDGGAGMGRGGVSGDQVARLVHGAQLRHLKTVALGFVSHQVLLVAILCCFQKSA